jgi:hypothetical protein
VRNILIILIFNSALNAFGQDLKILQEEIQQTVITDLKQVRKKADKIYQLDPYSEIATYYLLESYRHTDHLDSVPLLFAKLKSINRNNPIPYLLSAKYQFEKLSVSDTLSLEELKTAIKLDSSNFEAHYLLGKSYYTLFNQRHTSYYAFQSRANLIKATQLETSSLASLKYPIIQTSDFLEDANSMSVFENQRIDLSTDSLNIPKNGIWYFPLASFLELKDNWKSDYSFDVVLHVDMTTFSLDWYSKHLFVLREPLLFNQTEKTIYRFTWLRSFHKPVAIRVEKTKNSYMLYWKQSSGAGGYDPGELTVNKSKQLTKDEWDIFTSMIESTDFWNMPTNLDDSGCDGSRWIIEGIENHKYHVVDRWTPRKTNFQKCGQYLIELTDLKAKRSVLY